MQDKKELMEILKKKAKAYFKLATPVHIKYINGWWKNGVVVGIKEDFFVLREALEGLSRIFYFEIKDIEDFTETPIKKGVNKNAE